jgi:hypothetical protein
MSNFFYKFSRNIHDGLSLLCKVFLAPDTRDLLCFAVQGDEPEVGVKTLTGREVPRDPLQSSEGWSNFTSGFLVGGVSGVAWAYICTQILPFYS